MSDSPIVAPAPVVIDPSTLPAIGTDVPVVDGAGNAVVFSHDTDDLGSLTGTVTLQCVGPDNMIYWVPQFDPTLSEAPSQPADDSVVS